MDSQIPIYISIHFKIFHSDPLKLNFLIFLYIWIYFKSPYCIPLIYFMPKIFIQCHSASHLYTKILEKVNLKKGRFTLGLWFWRFQSMVIWVHWEQHSEKDMVGESYSPNCSQKAERRGKYLENNKPGPDTVFQVTPSWPTLFNKAPLVKFLVLPIRTSNDKFINEKLLSRSQSSNKPITFQKPHW